MCASVWACYVCFGVAVIQWVGACDVCFGVVAIIQCFIIILWVYALVLLLIGLSVSLYGRELQSSCAGHIFIFCYTFLRLNKKWN